MSKREYQKLGYKSDISMGAQVNLQIKVSGKIIELQANQDNSLEQILQALLQSEQQQILELNLKSIPMEKIKFKDSSAIKLEQSHQGQQLKHILSKESTLKDIRVYESKSEEYKTDLQAQGQQQKTKIIQIFWELEDSVEKQVQAFDNKEQLQDQQFEVRIEEKQHQKQEEKQQDQVPGFIKSKLASEQDMQSPLITQCEQNDGHHPEQPQEQKRQSQLQVERQRQLQLHKQRQLQLQKQRQRQQELQKQKQRLQLLQRNRQIFETQNQRQVVANSIEIEKANQASGPVEEQKTQIAVKKQSSGQKSKNSVSSPLKKVQNQQEQQISITITIGSKQVELDVLMQHNFNDVIESLIEFFQNLDTRNMDDIKIISIKTGSEFIDKNKPMRQLIQSQGTKYKIEINSIQPKLYGTQYDQADKQQSENQKQKLIGKAKTQEILQEKDRELKKSVHDPMEIPNTKNIPKNKNKEQKIKESKGCDCLIY